MKSVCIDFSRLANFGFLFCIVLNIFALFYSLPKEIPVPVEHFTVVTNFVYSVVSNSNPSASSSRPSPDILPPAPQKVACWRYSFFSVNGRRFCSAFSRIWSEGGLTSYGYISLIFPDRIILDSGDWIENDLSWLYQEYESLKQSKGVKGNVN